MIMSSRTHLEMQSSPDDKCLRWQRLTFWPNMLISPKIAVGLILLIIISSVALSASSESDLNEPTFIEPPQSTKVILGNPATLTCRIRSPDPMRPLRVKWFFNGRDLSLEGQQGHNGRIQISPD